MEDPESIQSMAEEIRILRRSVQRFGTYFVALTLVPLLWGGVALGVLWYFPTIRASILTPTEARKSEDAKTIAGLARVVSDQRHQIELKNMVNSYYGPRQLANSLIPDLKSDGAHSITTLESPDGSKIIKEEKVKVVPPTIRKAMPLPRGDGF